MNSFHLSGCWKRLCYDPNQKGDVDCCRFHPSKPKLACGLDGGRIWLFCGTSHSTPFCQWETKRILKAESKDDVRCIDWNVSQLSIIAKCFWMNRVAGVRMQISCWTGGWDGGGLEWRRDQIIRIERALWICQLHQLERGERDEPPVRHWQRWSGESSENLVNQSRLFVDKWRKQVTRGVLLIWRQRAIVWDSDEQAALQVFHFRSNWIREVTWISADVFAACSDDGTIRIYQLGQSAPKSFNHQVNEWIFRPNQCITLVT